MSDLLSALLKTAGQGISQTHTHTHTHTGETSHRPEDVTLRMPVQVLIYRENNSANPNKSEIMKKGETERERVRGGVSDGKPSEV